MTAVEPVGTKELPEAAPVHGSVDRDGDGSSERRPHHLTRFRGLARRSIPAQLGRLRKRFRAPWKSGARLETKRDRERGRLALLLAALAALILGAAAFAAIRPASKNPDFLGLRALRPSRAAQLPIMTPIRSTTVFATDGNLPSDNVPIWKIDSSGGGVVLRPTSPVDGSAGQTFRLPIRHIADTSYDVASWDTHDAESVFRIRQEASSVDVQVYELLGNPRLIGSGTAPTAPPAQPDVTREFAIARWTGPRPDLFVIDRGNRSERVRVAVYSGESAFVRRIAAFALPIRGAPPDQWAVDVFRFDGVRPDLAMVRRLAPSGPPELHVVSGESGFQRFVVQTPIALPPSSGGRRFIGGSSLGRSVVYALDLDLPRPPTLRILPAGGLITPPDG